MKELADAKRVRDGRRADLAEMQRTKNREIRQLTSEVKRLKCEEKDKEGKYRREMKIWRKVVNDLKSKVKKMK